MIAQIFDQLFEFTKLATQSSDDSHIKSTVGLFFIIIEINIFYRLQTKHVAITERMERCQLHPIRRTCYGPRSMALREMLIVRNSFGSACPGQDH